MIGKDLLWKWWGGFGVLKLLETGKDAGWMVAVILICLTTFAVSSVFVNRGFRQHG